MKFESLVIEFSQLIRSQKPPFEQFSTAERAGPRLLNCARVAMSLTPFRRSTPARAGFGLGAKAHGPPKCRPAYSHGPLAPRFPRIAFQIRRINYHFRSVHAPLLTPPHARDSSSHALAPSSPVLRNTGQACRGSPWLLASQSSFRSPCFPILALPAYTAPLAW